MDGTEARKVTLGFASLMAIAAWRVIAMDGEKVAPGDLAKTEAALASGAASLGIYVQKTGDALYISATALPSGPQDPFQGGNRMVIEGPVVFSTEQLAALVAIDPGKMN